jgi:stage II sporulation protein R
MLRTKSDRLTASFLAVLILLTGYAGFDAFYRQCSAVRENTLRLHVIANSDSAVDQQNKLLVRDAVLEEYALALSAGGTIDAAVAVTESLTDAIALTATKTLRDVGCTDGVTASVVTMYFDTITYDTGETMPAGEYQALRIVIGEGNGHNWWCVMYPPLCVPAATAGGEDIERIEQLNEGEHLTVKFAAVELYEKIIRKVNEMTGETA